ncbi:hypothetical protein QEG73_12280 [Chitinophagaceae bacterium 26-R-25]|nr:hypothetical protein [Chitinophagaceae bacterium 26-R-25]
MKVLFFTMLMALAIIASAQQNNSGKTLRHQLSITSDNDAYISLYIDRYYTNGLSLNYTWISRQPRTQKKNTVFTIKSANVQSVRLQGAQR